MTTLFGTALELTNQGVGVVPCIPKSKWPMYPWKQYQQRMPTKRELYNWFYRWPYNNIAVVTGDISDGLCILDLDNGLPNAVKWIKNYPKLLETQRVVTQRGMHIWTRVENPPVFDVTEDGVEIKYGGLCMTPPSVHPSGHVYKWIGNYPIVSIRSLEDIGIIGNGAPNGALDPHKKESCITSGIDSDKNTEGHVDTLLFLRGSRARSAHIIDIPACVRDPQKRRLMIHNIKDRISLIQLLKDIVIFRHVGETNQYLIGNCFMHEDNHPSLSYDSISDRCKCWNTKCTLHKGWADVLDVYMYLYHMDLWSAVTSLSRQVGLL